MTTAELILALSALPGDTPVVIDIRVDWLEPAVQVDDLGGGKSGVRLVHDAHDIESDEMVVAIQNALGSPVSQAGWVQS